MRFDGQVVWITGASSGIGAALAHAFAADGACLILSGRRAGALEALAGPLNERALALPFETTDWSALPDIVARASEWRGRIDVLVNNAGISQRSLAVDTRLDVYRRLLDVDLLAPIALTQAVLPGMVARRAGRIVGVSSLAGLFGVPLRTGYCAAKHGLIGYLDALRAEVDLAYGIGVTTVMPGSVRTGVATNALTADGTARGRSDANIDGGMDPAAVAARILAGIHAGERAIVIAEGGEEAATKLAMTDRERLYAMVAAQGARLALAGGEVERVKGIEPSS